MTDVRDSLRTGVFFCAFLSGEQRRRQARGERGSESRATGEARDSRPSLALA